MFIYFPLFLIIFFITSHLYNKVQNFPPTLFPTLPIIGHLYILKNTNHFHRTLTQISKWLGPVFHLWFGTHPVLVISSPSTAEECLKQKDTIFANRPLGLTSGKTIYYNYTTLVTSPYNDHWRKLRRISTLEILGANRLSALSYMRTDEVRLLVLRLLRLWDQDDNTPTLNMRSLFMEVTLNTMMRMIVGKRYYEDCIVSEEAEMFQEMITQTPKLSSYTLISDFIPMLRIFGYEKKIRKNMIELQNNRDKFMQNLIEQQKKATKNDDNSLSQEKKMKTMIEVLLTLQESEPEYYKDEIIKGLMLDLIIAGSDTSAGTMEIALSFLLNHPEVMKKAHSELVNCVGEDRLVNESDLAKLPYLHSIIKETLRLLPPGPLIARASSKETTIGGYRVPIGCMVLINTWAIQRDPNTWVEPNKFMPERFLKNEGLAPRELGFTFLAFGNGRRTCPGENLAWRMVGLTLATIIQCFEWERVSEKMVDMSEHLRGLTLSMTNPLLAKCQPRSTMMKVLSQIRN
ncbi:isoflavone 2'-hydroxylase-like [Humulus lupulus]|uniref:isoflavone 2'-hydroxylase-like n=1 Tax=Humulus lupulus TaxID=3486 RepID=UPI002B40732B|nr:isoflavone 2'-hydroxylase-like [Humulus lupulus]